MEGPIEKEMKGVLRVFTSYSAQGFVRKPANPLQFIMQQKPRIYSNYHNLSVNVLKFIHN